MGRRILTILVVSLVAAFLVGGCGSAPPPDSGVIQTDPISVSDAKVKAAKFVKELESVPAEMRGQFLMTHTQEAHAVGVSGDKALQEQFKALIAGGSGTK